MTSILDKVKDYLNQVDVDYEVEEESIWFTGEGDTGSYDMSFIVLKDYQNIFLFLEFGKIIPEHKRLNVAEFIVRINNMFPLGGFEMFIDKGFVKYKISNILKGGILSGEMLDEMVTDALFTMDISFPGFLAVCNKGKSAVEAFKIVENAILN
jgi:hypothetical protein